MSSRELDEPPKSRFEKKLKGGRKGAGTGAGMGAGAGRGAGLGFAEASVGLNSPKRKRPCGRE